MEAEYKIKLKKNQMKLKDIIELANLLKDSDFKIETKDLILGDIIKEHKFEDYNFVNAFSRTEMRNARSIVEEMLYKEEADLKSYFSGDIPKGSKLSKKEKNITEKNIKTYRNILDIFLSYIF